MADEPSTDCSCPVITRVIAGAFPDVAVVSYIEHTADCQMRVEPSR